MCVIIRERELCFYQDNEQKYALNGDGIQRQAYSVDFFYKEGHCSTGVTILPTPLISCYAVSQNNKF
jgi:hypothetical protein